MGCNQAKPDKQAAAGGGKRASVDVNEADADDSVIRLWLEQVRAIQQPPPTILRQFACVVRHGHRLDREQKEKWRINPDFKRVPYDTPLTTTGRKAARTVGETLKKMDSVASWGLVISSPYIRCVQTSAEIAQVLNLPLVFDVEFGEVFDQVYMPRGNGSIQFRPIDETLAILKQEYPTVEVAVKKQFGEQPHWPEDFGDAQVRFLERFETTVVKAVERLQSPIIVSHGDAVMILLALLCPRVELTKIDYCGWFVGWRDTAKPNKSDPLWREKLWDVPKQMSVYQQSWNVSIGTGIKFMPSSNTASSQIEQACMKEEATANVGAYRRNLKTERNMWTLSPDSVAQIKANQQALNAVPEPAKELAKWEDDKEESAAADVVRNKKKHLTGTADLLKKIAPALAQQRQHVDDES